MNHLLCVPDLKFDEIVIYYNDWSVSYRQAQEDMTVTMVQKIILIALLVVGGLSLIVGFALMHHIGGFLKTVEEEARQEEEARSAAGGADDRPTPRENGGGTGATQ